MRGRTRCGALLAIGVTAAAWALPASGGAATITPESLTGCYGNVSHDVTGKTNHEPNLLDYSFHCNTPITAYTIIANQKGAASAAGTIDDFNGSPTVLSYDNVTPVTNESVTCGGTIPSDGINCNTSALGATIAAENFIDGAIDLVQPYCKHLPTTPKGKLAKPGTPAVGQALVQLVVTDNTGAEDGPFTLARTKPCLPAPNKVPVSTSSTSSVR